MIVVLWLCYMIIVITIFVASVNNLVRLIKSKSSNILFKRHIVERLHFNSCKIRSCTSHFYPEMQLHTYVTTIQVGDHEGTTDNYELFKACKKYDKEKIVADVDVCIYSNGTSKIIVKEICETKFNEEVIFDGKYSK